FRDDERRRIDQGFRQRLAPVQRFDDFAPGRRQRGFIGRARLGVRLGEEDATTFRLEWVHIPWPAGLLACSCGRGPDTRMEPSAASQWLSAKTFSVTASAHPVLAGG